MKKEKFQFLHWNFSVLSYLDSNQDKLIQSQMCYRYTIGQSVFFFPFRGKVHSLRSCSFSFESGCKSTTFFGTGKIFLN